MLRGTIDKLTKGFSLACTDSRQKYRLTLIAWGDTVTILMNRIIYFFTEKSLQEVEYFSIAFKMAGIASYGGLPQCTNAGKKICFGK